MQGKNIKLKAIEFTLCRQEVPCVGHLLTAQAEYRPWIDKCCQRAAKTSRCEKNTESCSSNLSKLNDHITSEILTANMEKAHTQRECWTERRYKRTYLFGFKTTEKHLVLKYSSK